MVFMFFSSVLYFFLPILRRVREEQSVSACDHNQDFLSVSFFLPNPIVSE